MSLIIKPTGNRMFIILDEFQEKVGLIEMPSKHTEQSRFATVKACGDEVERFEKGDRVLVSFHSGMRIHLIKYHMIDDTYRIISEEEVMAKIEDEDGE